MAVEYLPVAMSGGGGYEFRIAREVTPQSGGTLVAATIQWRRPGSASSSSSNGAAPFALNIGGNVKSGTRNFNAPAGGPIDWQWIETHSVLFVSGSSTFITASFNTDTSAAGAGSISNWTTPLSSPSRATFATSPFPAGSPVTINTNRTDPAFTHNITYEFGSATGTVGTGVGASVAWTPPLSMLTAIPNATQAAGTITTVTKSGATTVGTTSTGFVLTAPASVKPTCSGVTATDQNSTVASIVGKPVQGLSVMRLVVSGAGVYGSTIRSAEAILQGVRVVSGGDVAVTTSGNIPISASVTDSRSRVGEWASTLNVLPYEPPKLTGPLLVRRADAAGALKDDGTYLRVDLPATAKTLPNGTERNSLTIKVGTRLRGATGGFTPRNVITPGLTHAGFFLITGGGIFGANDSWDVQVTLEDKFTSVPFAVPVGTATSVFHVTKTGKVAVGKRWQQGALDVGPGGIYDDGNRVINTSNVATQAQADAGTDDTRFLTPKKARDAIYSPHAEAGGEVTTSASAATTVTFPAGRFTVKPLLDQPSVIGHANVCVAYVSNLTSTGFDVRVYTLAGAQVAATIQWTATQMRSGSAAG